MPAPNAASRGRSRRPSGGQRVIGHLPPNPPRIGTYALRDFLVSLHRIQEFSEYLVSLAGAVDRGAEIAHRALMDSARDAVERDRLVTQWAGRASATEALKHQRQIFIEIVLARHVDNYLAFLSALLAEIFVARPETMKSAEKVDLEWVLGHQSMDSLIVGLAERKVDALAYQSFGGLRDHMRDRYGLQICTDDQAKVIVGAIETRNIIVHNRCVINRRFIERTQGDPAQLGKQHALSVMDTDRVVPVLLDSARSADRQARTNLRLPSHRFNSAALAASS